MDPIFKTLAPGRGTIERTKGREKLGGTAEDGYLHCGPSGAGHFVKMVHNGIEYGIMAAYAEGLNCSTMPTGQAEPAGQRRTDAAPPSRALPIRPEPGRHHRTVAPRQRRRILAAGPHRHRPGRRSTVLKLRGPRVRFGRRPLDHPRCHRYGHTRAGLEQLAVLALRITRRRRFRQQAPVGHALPVRRAPRAAEEIVQS